VALGRNSFKLLFLVTLLFIVVSGLDIPAYSQATTDNFLDPILGQYADNASRWEAPLKGFAMKLFWLLALIDFVWIGIQLVFNNGELGDWLESLCKQILFIGFFYALLTHSSDWANALISSFRLAGDNASGAVGGAAGLEPSNIFDAGANIATACLKSMKIEKMMDSLAMVFSAIVIMISFALIAALEVVVLVESYIFTYAGIIFLGFGGSHFTKDFALRYMTGIVAVGAKLFVIQLIIGLAQTMVQQWEAQVMASSAFIDMALVIKMIGGSIVFLALAKMIPETVQGMINGASYGSGRGLINSGMAVGHVGMAIGSGVGAATTGLLGGAAGALGMCGVASSLSSASSFLGQSAGNHSNDAFRQAFDTDAGAFGQYMPGTIRGDSQSQIKPSFRGGEPGEDLNPQEERNTIGV
jgi:type IV secretion system protein TrbL